MYPSEPSLSASEGPRARARKAATDGVDGRGPLPLHRALLRMQLGIVLGIVLRRVLRHVLRVLLRWHELRR